MKNFNIYNVNCFKKNKEKHLEISLFYTCVPKILIWSTVLEIVWQTEIGNYGFWVIGNYSLPFAPPPCPPSSLITQKLKILKIWKKHQDIISNFCTTNDNHLWYMVSEIWSTTKRIFCLFALFFALLPPPSSFCP